MQYLGSKNKIAKYILPILLKDRQNRTWVEPFVGGANIIDKVNGERIGNDINPYLISLLKAVQSGWIPPTTISREDYYQIKNNKNAYSEELVGFVGFLCSFGSKWFGGYAFNNKGDNYAERGSRALVKQSKNLVGVKFTCLNYWDLNIPSNSLIYCDPPYEGTTKYSANKEGFDHERFWNWCREKSCAGHLVFVSEYAAPEDFECVKEIEYKTILDKNSQNSQYKRVEKLFQYLKSKD